MEKAFDSVWFIGLLYKLIIHNFPDSIVHLIASYLHQRTFQVKIDNTLSSRRKILAGVPQGSVIAPTLYNIYTSDIPEQQNSQIAQFADDTVLFYKHYNIINSTNNIQCHLQKISQWCNKWRIKINEGKSSVVIFTRRRPPTPPPLKFQDKPLKFCSSTKYLGILMDSKLTWNKHVQFIRGKVIQRIHQLYPLLTSPALHLHKKRLLYKSLILPIIMYGAPAWGTTANTHIQKLQVLQNKVARIITGADYYTRISQLHDDLQLNYIRDEIIKSTRTLYTSASVNENPLISNLGKYKKEQLTYKMPACLISDL